MRHAEKIVKEIDDSSNKKREKIIESVRIKMEKEKSRKLSIKEGSAASIMTGFGDSYITPYALALNANNIHIGLLTSLTNLFAPLSQLFGSKLMEKTKRKKIVTKFVFAQALMWILMISLAFLFWKNIVPGMIPVALLIIYVSYAVIGSIPGPAWFSWIGDLVPEEIRGKYFSRRNVICGIIALISMLLGALILDVFKTKGFVLFGFSIIFFIAMIGRIFSAYFFTKQYEPKFKLQKDYYFSLWSFIKKSPFNNFGRFAIFVALIQFATAIAGPFFAVYMLKDLNFSYTTYTIVNLSASVFSLIFMPFFGKFSDLFGNRRLLRFGGILIPIMPLLWLVSSSPYYIAFVPQLIGGIGWAAFNLAAGNFIYDSVIPQRRGICVAYFNLFIGFGIFFGATLGGILAQYVQLSFINKFFFIFIISGFLRAVISLIFLPTIKEVRKIRTDGAWKAFKEVMPNIKALVPMKGVVYHSIGSYRGFFKKNR